MERNIYSHCYFHLVGRTAHIKFANRAKRAPHRERRERAVMHGPAIVTEHEKSTDRD
jgi:hypothetical protein